ncbi:hypothetical protein L861_04325 [Litchfieldella anticariensis FP35 = DSM 16096]|uniref:Uncharacterized protein n=1 Tax=Litchfieldella anticariensis (strain DSM 16096 / CECT 5854 / CIP 108499 / LMG 22089 / FP35) TaxID=1121939 RepID=S2LIV2_LITA3|nr:hypothetical protein L861_04325 [Halomonas anticariensis FP35 = DSM 16096]
MKKGPVGEFLLATADYGRQWTPGIRSGRGIILASWNDCGQVGSEI